MQTSNTVLWWGRHDPDYSRNRVVRSLFARLGWRVRDFRPHLSGLGDIEAFLRGVERPDLVWVPCFRQRDVLAAARWARRRGIPLVFDPLISAWDKRVLEFEKVEPESAAAHRLLAHERHEFAAADVIVADTKEHARFFAEKLGVDPKRILVLYVGAETEIFPPLPPAPRGSVLEVLFYGSMLPLQGPETIVEAAKLTAGEPIHWTIVGKGPRLAACIEKAGEIQKPTNGVRTNSVNVTFMGTVPYGELSMLMAKAHVLLGVFGTTPKAGRVMPNKFFQALASGRPVMTRASAAYPPEVASSPAVTFVPPGDAASLADAVRHLAKNSAALDAATCAARPLFESVFSPDVLTDQLKEILRACGVRGAPALPLRGGIGDGASPRRGCADVSALPSAPIDGVIGDGASPRRGCADVSALPSAPIDGGIGDGASPRRGCVDVSALPSAPIDGVIGAGASPRRDFHEVKED